MRIRSDVWGVDSAVVTDQFLITAGYKAIRVYDWPKHSEVFEIREIKEHFGRIKSLAVSSDFKKLAVGGSNGAIGIYQLLPSGELITPEKFLVDQQNDVLRMVFNQDGTRLVSLDRRGINLWDVEALKSLKHFELPPGSYLKATLAAAGTDFYVTNGKDTDIYGFQSGERTGRRVSEAHLVNAAAVSPSGKLTAIASGSNVQVYDRKGKQLKEFRTAGGGLSRSIVFVDERTLIVGGRGKVTKWNIKQGKLLREFEIPDLSYIRHIEISHDRNQIVVTGSSSKDAFLIDIAE